MEKSCYKSPIGSLEIICENNELLSLKLCKCAKAETKETAFIKTVKLQLEEYFSGKRQTFDIKLSPKGTAFQKLVWAELEKIPYGTTKSYSEIAKNIGKETAQRAVGNACNKNPIIILIPCHRVISKSGHLGGFAIGNEIKQKLLEIENSKCFL